ncbi:MFS transporter [Ralstonia syzygii]|uniref:MFS transporter n=1 Tax=Ralstonia syzygii TaxID=28097 RepID=A0ABX7ZEK7_9RALS|nr:MFS transporter [Ralstonia syzygii]QUP53846.1 MFS transporter [Ralstonia syzygii]
MSDNAATSIGLHDTSGDTSTRQGPGRARATLIAALLGFFVITLDAVVVNVALPTIGRDLQAGVTGLQWVIDGYTLLFAALLLSAGAFTDRIGARRAFGLGLVVFIIASVACGLAPTLGLLVTARILQGSGAAVMMPSSMALIRQAYPEPASRAHAVAIWAMGGAVAASSGPVLGGLLTLLSWRWIFLINLPVGVATLIILKRVQASPRREAPFDLLGQITAILAMGALTYGAIEAGAIGLSAPPVPAAFAVAAIALLTFLTSQRRTAHPLVPPDVLRSRNARIAMAIGFTFMVGYFGLPFVMSLYLQQHRGLSAFATGAAFLPMMLTGLALTPFSARLAARLSPRVVIVAGLMSMSLGLFALSLLPESAAIWQICALTILVGIAGPLVAPPVTAVLLASVPASLAGTASGVFNTSRQVGGALAVAVFGALVAQSHTFMAGMRASLILAAGVALATAIASLQL